ncbi:conserved Plasmodium protein, unknown function [Plasmodium vivax]|uniref:(malaria parasite P. vivax) hypothetical protein n=1 Tax=Plasmodium vivax TaxID=5855 RepID=A0A1G4H131_PLAVI|nr:unnamed protein product [Plasmodium vivax]CAI7721991.1 WPP motif-containing protein, putative [Plasmodium vivax]SCO68564.1 conserved Plasmodium protein, unknown function [Plasmodium vivax]SCO74028.1 conserved Plasmodium protein, unknown function [Plasmodium vivax]VUZ97459.1 conserved protein, unknown function [Plasmodium vivax]
MFPAQFLRRTATRFAKKKFFASTREQNLGNTAQCSGNEATTDVYDNYEALKNVKEKSSLQSALKRFREIVQRETKRKGYHFYAGWPPRNRIRITQDEKLGLYGRTLFVLNRVKGVKEVEPNLCICCKNKNILFLNKPEFESLLKNMEAIKHQLQEFAKKL